MKWQKIYAWGMKFQSSFIAAELSIYSYYCENPNPSYNTREHCNYLNLKEIQIGSRKTEMKNNCIKLKYQMFWMNSKLFPLIFCELEKKLMGFFSPAKANQPEVEPKQCFVAKTSATRFVLSPITVNIQKFVFKVLSYETLWSLRFT